MFLVAAATLGVPDSSWPHHRFAAINLTPLSFTRTNPHTHRMAMTSERTALKTRLRSVDPTNPTRGEVTRPRWNSHYLIPSTASFTPPDWVLVTARGPDLAPAASDVIGRYAFAVYDEGGLLDMNLAGFPTWSGSSDDSPVPTPTPWQVNVGRKGIVAFADPTAFPAPTPTSSEIRRIVGWRNYGTTKQIATSFGRFSFQLSPNLQQDAWGTYLLDFGDAPYADPSIYPFTSVPSDFSSDSRTYQALMSRRELL